MIEMKTLLLVHGPNLNQMGTPDSHHYESSLTLADIETAVKAHANAQGYNLISFQSNHEGELIDYIQVQTHRTLALIINAGALTHYSYALYDAILDSGLPTVEVHLSNASEREPWRANTILEPACLKRIVGKELQCYLDAIDLIVAHLHRDDLAVVPKQA